MFSIILAVVIGVFFTAVAFQNPGAVTINFLNYTFAIPTYLFAAISFLFGVGVSLIFHLVDMASASLNLSSKNTQISRLARVNQDLQRNFQQVVNENTQLKQRFGEVKTDLREEKVEQTKETIKDFFRRPHQNLAS
jgi:hypothetical protein